MSPEFTEILRHVCACVRTERNIFFFRIRLNSEMIFPTVEKLYYIAPFRAKHTHLSLTRGDQVIKSLVVIYVGGHIWLTHSYLMKSEMVALCTFSYETLTVVHVFVQALHINSGSVF